MSRPIPEGVEAPDVSPFGCKCKTLAHHLNGDGCDECNPSLALEHAMATISDLESDAADKDALIREFVKSIQGFQKLLEDGPENASFSQCEDALVAAADTLTLARTTCPELF